jgi:uracil-DNA glycosylase
MADGHEAAELLAALRGYLEELQETGVDGLPRETAPRQAAAPPAPGQPVAGPAAGRQVPKPAAPAVASTLPPAGETLEQIRAELGDCQRCGLGASRSHLVYGAGDPHARLVFVGEAPGFEEDRQGEPFVGEAGQLLTRIIQAMGLSRDEVYICNVLKCRPPENRNPHHDEIEACRPFLQRQLQAIAPAAIITLGTFATQTLLHTKEPISRLRGRFHDFHGIPLMPTFHPAFLLRSPEKKREVWDDVQQVMKLLGRHPPAG